MPIVETSTPLEARSALGRALEHGCLVSVYASENVDRFSVGYVDAVSDTHVRLGAVDLAGRANGIEIRALSTIHHVETDDDYLNRRVQPLTAHWRDHGCGWPEQRLVGDHCDIVLDALTLSLEDRNAVTVWMGDAQYTGPVVKLSDTGGAIVDLDEFGNRDHEVAFRVSEIDALDFGCEHQRIAQFLMKTGEER